MTKKIISLVLTFLIVVSVMPAGAADAELIVNETFDNYALNDQNPSGVNIAAGLDARVVSKGGADKALYSKLWGNSAKFVIPVENCPDKAVFAFDLMLDGKTISGSAIGLGGNTPVFRFTENEKIVMDNDKTVATYRSGVWKKYAVAVDFSNGTYDLFIDGKYILQNRYFLTAPKTVSEFSMQFTCSDEDEIGKVYVDNIKVYAGSDVKLSQKYVSVGTNSEVLEYEESDEKVVYDKVFIDSFGREGLSNSLTQKDDTIAQWEKLPGTDMDFIRFVKKGTYDTFTDISTGITDSQKIVLQLDMYPVRAENATARMAIMYDKSGNTMELLRMYYTGALMVGGTGVGTLPNGEITNIAVACDLLNGICDVYINRELKQSGIPLPKAGFMPSKFRVGYASTTNVGYNEYYISNFKLYEGMKLREFDDEAKLNDNETNSNTDGNYESINEKAAAVQMWLGYDTVFMTSNSKCYINKEKKDYADFGVYPYTDDNGILMVPQKIVESAFGIIFKTDDSKTYTADGKYTITAGSKIYTSNKASGELETAPTVKDSILYLPIKSFASDVLKMYTYCDDRGFVLISEEDRKYSNDMGNNKQIIDSIQRYMHFDRPSGEAIYEAFKNTAYGVHPRIIATPQEFEEWKKRIKTVPEYTEAYKKLIVDCENIMELPPATYNKHDGLRLSTALSTNAGGRIRSLGMAYQLSGDDKYAERAWQEIENILYWPDWNLDAHFLDSGSAVPHITAGYDCIYDYLTDERKALFNERFQVMYLDYVVGTCTGNSKYTLHDSRQTNSNWGAVCSDAMLHAAFMMMDAEDENSELTKKCKFIAESVLQSVEFPVSLLFPSGVTSEGFVYWEYYLTHITRIIDILRRHCSVDYGLSTSPGYPESVYYGIYCQTEQGAWPYSDTKIDLGTYLPESVFLFAKLRGDKELSDTLSVIREKFKLKSSIGGKALWHTPSDNTNLTLSTDYYTPGEEIVSVRSSWEDSNGVFLATLGGTNSLTMSHIDKGTFIYDALGERWFLDIGYDNYNVSPSYWSKEARIKLYRIRTEGHNCVVINPDKDDFGQELNKTAKVVRYESKPSGALAVYDLTEVYGDKTSGYKRGFHFTDDRERVIVQDEITLAEPAEVYSFFHTQADIEILPDGKTAILSKNGKQIKMEFYSNADNWSVKAMDADPLDEKTFLEGEYSREGLRKVAFHCPEASGDVVISVSIVPVDEHSQYAPHSYQPIDEWSIPDGESNIPKLTTLTANGITIEGFSPNVREYTINIPYGSPIPLFAAASDNSTVEITQPASFADKCVIMVTNNAGKKKIYTVAFKLEIVIDNNLSNISPAVGLPDGANLIKPSGVYADHEPQEAHLAPCATDGKFDTSWTSNADGTYIELDLGEIRSFDGIAAAFLTGNERVYSYEILISEDKQHYTRVFSGKSTGKTAEYEDLAISGKARFVRLVGHFNDKSTWNNVAEFSVYTR